MPTMRKLTPAEVRTVEDTGTGQRKLTEEQYDRLLAPFAAGEYGAAEPDDDEKRLAVRYRLKAAAARRGVELHFLRTTGNVIWFHVVSDNGHHAEQPHTDVREAKPAPAAAAPPPAPKRRGRPKKQVT